MENRIKEQQLDLFADRTSTHTMRANQIRLYFSSFAYVLLCALRRLGLQDTELARAQCGTIRTRLLKIGAQVRVSVRRVWISFSECFPAQASVRPGAAQDPGRDGVAQRPLTARTPSPIERPIGALAERRRGRLWLGDARCTLFVYAWRSIRPGWGEFRRCSPGPASWRAPLRSEYLLNSGPIAHRPRPTGELMRA